MDHRQVLLALTNNERQEGKSFDESLEQLMSKVVSLLPEEYREKITMFKETEDNQSSIRSQYLKTILYVLESLKDTDLSSSDTFLSVQQHKTVKAAVEIAVSFGILDCLLPGIGAGMSKLCPRAAQLDKEKLTDLQKYDRLSSTVRSITDCFNEVALRAALLPQLGPILGALLQLSYAPLMKPSQIVKESENRASSKFTMTPELYEKLTKEQEDFRQRLEILIANCPQASVMKELMVIVGVKDAPKWISRRAREYVIHGIVRPNGIVALVDAVCNDVIDLGAHWDKLDVVARLVANSHSQNPDKYYEAVCTQLVNLLTSRTLKHSATIANSCITALYESNPRVCVEKVLRVIAAPLKIVSSSTADKIVKTESEVADCIDNLTKCFGTTDAKFKHPPCTLMNEIAVPLFCLHAKARQTVLLIRRKIKDLLIHFLTETTSRDDIYSVFLEHDVNSGRFGEKITCRIGPNGSLEVTTETEESDHEEAADSLFELVANDKNLAFSLFNYLLRSFSVLTKSTDQNKNPHVLENTEDTLDRVGKQLAMMKLLSNLAGTRVIQEALKNDPRPLLSFVKTLFNEKSCNDEDENVEVLYVSLMLIKVILTDSGKPTDWSGYNELATFLKNKTKVGDKIPQQLRALVEELLDVIKNQGRSATRHYQDLSFDSRKKESDFEKALKDLADPLLPVRAHGLMSLTKLVESKDPEATAKKDIILCFFQENLKNEDSFVYLAAVNGLCALATVFPQKVIETLVQEYIDMPERSAGGEISPETRAKLGEILVKTTRALGEMAPAYKSILINGFLCGTRDSDDMVRASSLSCLGELCKVLGFRLGHSIIEVLYCIKCIIDTDKAPECRRAAVLVATLLIRGLGKDVLTDLGSDLVPLYRALKFLRDNDDDQVLRLHAQLALEELDDIVQTLLFATPDLKKRIFLLP